MAGNRPMITLQCGNYANYIGTHFWNLQEAGFVYGGNDGKSGELLEVDNDVLFREGLTLKGEVTYTPRLLSLDLQGSLGLLPQCGELYGRPQIPSSESIPWGAGCQVFKEEPHKKNDFLRELDQDAMDDEANEKDIDICMDSSEREKEGDLYNLDDQVAFWSDYLGARFHPKSVLLVKSFQHENTTHPFDVWGLGRGAWKGGDGVGEEVEDRLRLMAEECDLLGGVQLVADWQGGWGGVTSQVVELVRDEYASKPLLTFPCAPATLPTYTPEQGLLRLAGAALTMSSALSSSLTSPLSLCRDWLPLAGRSTSIKHCPYNASLAYHSAAVIALTLDTATLPYRRREGRGPSLSPGELCHNLATHGRKLAALSTDLPVSIDFPDTASYIESDILSRSASLLPGTASSGASSVFSPNPYFALLTLRGLQAPALHSRRSSKFQACPSAAAYLASAVNSHRRDCRPVAAYLFTKPAPTGKPFPHIFSPSVEPCGTLGQEERPSSQGVSYVTQLTAWSAGPEAGAAVSGLAQKASKLQLGKVHRLTESGVEVEEWEEALESLRELADCYSEEDF